MDCEEKLARWYEDIKAIGFETALINIEGRTSIVVLQVVSKYNTFIKFSKEIT